MNERISNPLFDMVLAWLIYRTLEKEAENKEWLRELLYTSPMDTYPTNLYSFKKMDKNGIYGLLSTQTEIFNELNKKLDKI